MEERLKSVEIYFTFVLKNSVCFTLIRDGIGDVGLVREVKVVCSRKPNDCYDYHEDNR